MTLYTKKEWKEFRDNVIEADGYKCTICGRTSEEVTLQVHHKEYIKGKLPWEYGLDKCQTICKGCHAAEHGIIKPKFGWEYVGDDDLEDLIGTCENCGAAIRYVFVVYHKDWGYMDVGTLCCDNLTDTEIASNKRESQQRFKGRKSRFLKSKRWKFSDGKYKIRQSLFDIEIEEVKNYYYLTIHNLKSSRKYESLDEAKSAAFGVIESGELYEYLDKHNISYRKKKRKEKE
ncbi:MAG: hypothetical protein DRJ01_16945 [Bacteroidetes bacterium]|nr:MAG: hypothetical protein DRJ01_16945 [Bacteroidota bacterium]